MIHIGKYALVPGIFLAFSTVAQNADEPGLPSYLERAQSQQEDAVTITVAVPSAGEAQELFGVSLYRRKNSAGLA